MAIEDLFVLEPKRLFEGYLLITVSELFIFDFYKKFYFSELLTLFNLVIGVLKFSINPLLVTLIMALFVRSSSF